MAHRPGMKEQQVGQSWLDLGEPPPKGLHPIRGKRQGWCCSTGSNQFRQYCRYA
jgi:hypothetical protein